MAGLTSSAVALRREQGRVNSQDTSTSRSRLDILHANLFTRFNAIVAALAVVVLVFGHPIDALFALVMVSNIVIGVVQELRAKHTLDALQVLVAPTVIAVRDGEERTVPVNQLVIDDCILLRAGDQVPVDGRVTESHGLEVDESALTGESKPVRKAVGDDVLSGSSVVVGAATVVAIAVGRDAWIDKLVREAKEFVLTQSELRVGVDSILRIISWILPPLAALLFWSQLRDDGEIAAGMVAATAGVVALVPQGLVLLVSMAMAVAVMKLARRSVVVQELPAVEGLARADVICLDKTGTLTTGRTTVESIEPLDVGERSAMFDGLAAMAAAEPSPTTAMTLVAATIAQERSASVGAPGAAPPWPVVASVPFSSERKWSSATFEANGTWLIGAPEVLLDAMPAAAAAPVLARVETHTATARRVLLVARASSTVDEARLPCDLRPVGVVVMAEELRSDAASTLRYFNDQGVAVKIISGDSADTVAAVGRHLGIPGADDVIDMRSVASIDQAVASENTIFGRVQPEQKQALVVALQSAGHTVAMTGDGVNDIPALKKADIGIAMDTATSATKAVSQLVLLNGRFDLLPGVVGEGRRVVANMERVSSLFVAKTAYAAIFALVIGVTAVEFPFLPRHLTLVDSLTIGIPAFILSFQPAAEPCRTGYLRRVLRFALPAGLGAAVVTLFAYGGTRRFFGGPLDEARTVATIALALAGFLILYWLIRPLSRIEGALIAGLLGLFVLAMFLPPVGNFYALAIPGPEAAALAVALVATLGIGVHTALMWRNRRGLTRSPNRKDPTMTTAIVGLDGSTNAQAAQRWAEAFVGAEGNVQQLRVLDGDPASKLIAAAAAADADLIVVGAHGGDSQLVRRVGSVVHKLLRDAPCPVAVVKNGEFSEDGPIVVGVGNGPATAAALEWATATAATHAQPMHLVRAVNLHPMFGLDDPFDVMASYIDPDQILKWSEGELTRVADQVGTRGVDVSFSVRPGGSGPRVTEAAEGAAMLVIGKHFDGPHTGYLTSRCLHHALIHATCPVVVVSPARGDEGS